MKPAIGVTGSSNIDNQRNNVSTIEHEKRNVNANVLKEEIKAKLRRNTVGGLVSNKTKCEGANGERLFAQSWSDAESWGI